MAVMSLAEYHALDAVSNGRIADFIAGPDLYFARYLCPPDDPRHIPSEHTGGTRIGSMAHCLVLEGQDELERRYRPWRGGLTKGTASKKTGEVTGQRATMSKTSEAYAEFLADCRADGVTACDTNDLDVCESIALALYDNADARYLLGVPGKDKEPVSEGENEVTLLFDVLGMPAKARPDRIIPASNSVIDLKTTIAESLDDVRRLAIKHGYHRQAAWYRRAYLANYGRPAALSPFVTVRSEKPYRVWVWTFDAEAELVADMQIDLALADILGRTQTCDWTPDECREPQWEKVGMKPYEIPANVAERLKDRASAPQEWGT